MDFRRQCKLAQWLGRSQQGAVLASAAPHRRGPGVPGPGSTGPAGEDPLWRSRASPRSADKLPGSAEN